MTVGYRLPRCLNRGGNWNNGADAGVFNSNLNNPRSNSNTNIGGRSASRHTFDWWFHLPEGL